MRIGLWGYYGVNYGDDIMLKVLLEYFCKKNIHVDLIDFTGKLNHLENYNNNINVISFAKIPKVKKFYKLVYLSKANINIWGGGTIFTDQDGDGNFNMFRRIKRLGGNIGYIGVGIGSLNEKSRLFKTKWLLNKSNLTIFRDQNSLEIARNICPNESFNIADDLSYFYFDNQKNSNSTSIANQENYILLTWRNLIGYMEKEKELILMDEIVNNIIDIMNNKSYETIILSALDSDYDKESCLILNKKLKERNINVLNDEDSDIDHVTNVIQNASLHISGRLHGSIASEFYNTPTITLAYSKKIQYFYQSIGSNKYIDIYNENVSDAFKKLFNSIKNKQLLDLSANLTRSQLNFKLMDQYFKI